MAKSHYSPEPLKKAFVDLWIPEANAEVLDLGWAGDVFVNEKASYGSTVTFVGDDIRAVRVSISQGCDAIHAASPRELAKQFGAVFYHPAGHSAKGQVFEWIESAHERLKIEGDFYIAGQKDRGILSYVKYVEQVFGNVRRVGRLGRMQFFTAKKVNDSVRVQSVDTTHTVTYSNVAKKDYSFVTCDGVFSRDGIDPGSQLLLEHLSPSSDATVLDIGCGYGLLGLVCADLVTQGHVTLTDVSARAVACTQQNIFNNRIENAVAEVGDLYEVAQGQQFDLIISNPPFHEGNQTGWPLIDGAWDHLKDNGELVLVVMRPVPYQKRMEKVFGGYEICTESNGYTVVKALKKN